MRCSVARVVGATHVAGVAGVAAAIEFRRAPRRTSTEAPARRAAIAAQSAALPPPTTSTSTAARVSIISEVQARATILADNSSSISEVPSSQDVRQKLVGVLAEPWRRLVAH